MEPASCPGQPSRPQVNALTVNAAGKLQESHTSLRHVLPVRLRKMDVCSPMELVVSVYRGHLVEGFREQTPLASVLAERWYMAPGVQRIDIRQEAVRGTLFIPPGTPASPAATQTESNITSGSGSQTGK